MKKMNSDDIVGKRIGNLTYTGKMEDVSDWRIKILEAVCDCGNIAWIPLGHRNNRKQCKKTCQNQTTTKQETSKYFGSSMLSFYKSNNKFEEFDLTLKDLDDLYEKQNGLCYYSGVKLTLPDLRRNADRQRKSYNVSIDRLDSSIGYVISNVVLTTKTINRMKMELDVDSFIKICLEIAEYDSKNSRRNNGTNP